MLNSRKVILVSIALVLILMAGFASFVPFSHAETVGSWSATANYPFEFGLGSCVTSGSDAYCIGGYASTSQTNVTYYGALSSSGVNSWSSSAQYPLKIDTQSCVASNGYIYCVGGYLSSNLPTNETYYAPLSSSGIGAWSRSTDYPTNIYSQSCIVNYVYIYCIGGYTTSSGLSYTNAVYYAEISSTGIGAWTLSTNNYPISIAQQSCVASGGYAYCVGGYTNPSGTGATYFAQLTNSGIGTWNGGSSYPWPNWSQSCVPSAGYIYCVGGAGGVGGGGSSNGVAYAPLSSSGIGTWTSTTNYPQSVVDESCLANSGDLYCVGGYPGNVVYFTAISSPTTSSSSSTSQATSNTQDNGILGSWLETANFTQPIVTSTCVSDSGYDYCLGGFNASSGGLSNAVYFSKLSSSGVSSWAQSTTYPAVVSEQSCVVSSGYIYCVGGNIGAGVATSAVYYATISSSGIGSWKSTTSYPYSVDAQACVVSTGYVYCVGGYDGSDGGSVSNSYYAQLSSTGVGTWVSTTSYPYDISYQNCVSNGGYIYCIAGLSGGSNEANSYYASLNSGGIGSWSPTTSYPLAITSSSCSVSSGYVYCIGGSIEISKVSYDTSTSYYAPLSSNGIGTWSTVSSYPLLVDFGAAGGCVTSSGYIYCVQGNTPQSTPYNYEAYYAGILSSTTSTTTVTLPGSTSTVVSTVTQDETSTTTVISSTTINDIVTSISTTTVTQSAEGRASIAVYVYSSGGVAIGGNPVTLSNSSYSSTLNTNSSGQVVFSNLVPDSVYSVNSTVDGANLSAPVNVHRGEAVVVLEPTPAQTLTTETMTATESNGQSIAFSFSTNNPTTNVTDAQIISSATSPVVSFSITGKSGTSAILNATIPKTAVPNGLVPTVYIDGSPAASQSYTQDANNYYITFSTQFWHINMHVPPAYTH